MAHDHNDRMRLKPKRVVGIPIVVVLKVHGDASWELTSAKSFVARTVDVPLGEKQGTLPREPPIKRDAWALREELMELKTEQGFLDFLNKVGRFTMGFIEQRDAWTLQDMTGCQRMLTELARRSPETWSAYADGLSQKDSIVPWRIGFAFQLRKSHLVQFRWKGSSDDAWLGARNIALIETTDALSAILATIEVDHLRGAKFGACARPDCPRFFEIESKHKRKYCGQYCAHLESVRRTREKQRKAKAKARTQKK
jgi:hypothetical protein